MKIARWFIYFVFVMHLPHNSASQERGVVDSTLSIIDTCKSDRKKVDLFVQIAQHLDASDSAKTVFYANEASELARKIEYKEGEIDAYYARASVAMSMGHMPEATAGFQEVVDMSRAAGYKLGEANGLNGLGATRDFQGDYAKALEYLLLSMKLSEEEDNQEAVASRCNNIGLVFSAQDDYQSAITYLERGLEIYKSLGDLQGTAVVSSNLGEVLMKSGQLEVAHKHFNESLNLYSRIQDENGIGFTHKNLADLCQKKGDITGSIEHYNTALEIYNRIGGQYFISYAHIGLGLSFLKLGNNSLAKKHFITGVNLAEQLNHKINIREGWKYLAQIEEQSGNYQAALEAQKKFKQAADSILNTEQTKSLTKLEANYEFQREKDSISFVQQRATLAYEEQLRKKQFTIQAAIGGVILVLIILLVVYRSNIINQQKNKELTHKNEIIELKNDELEYKNKQISNLLESEQKLAKETLELKERELATLTMVSHEKNTILQKLGGQIGQLSDKVNQEVAPDIKEIKRTIKANISDESWSSFTYHFEKVHPEFLNGLKSKYPAITQNDLKLCAYLKVGMDNKEIAQLSNVTVSAVKKSVQRLKKKMDLGPDDDLRELLIQL